MYNPSYVERFSVELSSAPEGISQQEWEVRLELAATYRLVDHYGWTAVVYNHISRRIPGTDTVLINPFGMRYDEIRASDLIKIDMDGNALSKSDWPVNRAGFLIHSTLHKARPDLHAIIHTHEPISQALCAIEEDVVPVTQEGCQFFERIAYHEFEGIVLDGSEGPRISAAIGQHNHTLVLKNHGLITAGSNCTWAFVRHMAFIQNAKVQLSAMSAGTLKPIPEDVMRKTRQQFEGGEAQAGAKERHPEWPALVRMIDQKDPSWKL